MNRKCLMLMLLLISGCAGTLNPSPEWFMKERRPPDLFLTDDTPCWYVRKPTIYRGELICELSHLQTKED